jgi:hypothetical protein
MGFESTRQNALPIWLDGPVARAYEGAQGKLQDDELAATKAAVKLRWPLPGCIDPSDDAALEAAGAARGGILRAPIESGVDYRDRLAGAHVRWYWAGTKGAYYNVFEPYTPNALGTPPSDELFRAPDGSTSQKHTPPTSLWLYVMSNHEADGYWDGNADWFSRVFVGVDCREGPWDIDSPWDDPGEYDDGGLWDTTMTVLDVRYLLSMIRTWKAVDSYPVTLAIWLESNVPADGFWWSPGEWDDGGNWEDESTADPLYITVGHVWHEEAGLGGWLGPVGDYPLTDLWSDDENDGLPPWQGFVDPIQFGG